MHVSFLNVYAGLFSTCIALVMCVYTFLFYIYIHIACLRVHTRLFSKCIYTSLFYMYIHLSFLYECLSLMRIYAFLFYVCRALWRETGLFSTCVGLFDVIQVSVGVFFTCISLAWYRSLFWICRSLFYRYILFCISCILF